jgi:hypothetical protein
MRAACYLLSSLVSLLVSTEVLLASTPALLARLRAKYKVPAECYVVYREMLFDVLIKGPPGKKT